MVFLSLEELTLVGKFKTKLNFKTEGTGDKMSVTAYATDIDGIECSATVTMEMAKSEGWTQEY